MFVDLEGFVVEGSESTDTAEATAEHEPDVAQRGEGGGYVGPDSFVTSRAVLARTANMTKICPNQTWNSKL